MSNVVTQKIAISKPGLKQAHIMSQDVLCTVTEIGDGDIVECISLEEALNKIPENELVLKIDCEGSEYDILLPAPKHVIRKFKYIYAEFHDNINKTHTSVELKKFIEDMGYASEEIVEEIPDGAQGWYTTDDKNNVISFVPFTHDKEKDVVLSKFKFTRIEEPKNDMQKSEIQILGSSAKYTVTVGIPTRNRYDVLSHGMLSIAMQTVKPQEIIVVDDSDNPVDLRTLPNFAYLFNMLDNYDIKWKVLFGLKKGPHYSHQIVQDNAISNLILRIDDDEIAEPNAIEKLLSSFNSKVGAVAPLVLMPGKPQGLPKEAANIITDMALPNIQWFKWEGQKKVEHLYSCFMYRKGVANYELSLSKKGFREESLFSHEILRKGYELIVNANAIVYHWRAQKGGIRE